MVEDYAVEALKSWFTSNKEFFKNAGIDSSYNETEHGSANVQLDGDIRIADICVWNHASCLDIQIIEVESEESTFPHAGKCESKEIFIGQLNAVLQCF